MFKSLFIPKIKERQYVYYIILISHLKPAFQHRNAAEAAFRCGWNRRPIHWTSEKLSVLSDVIYSVTWLICISNALISMRINDSNVTERLSEKTDHGSMRFGHYISIF